MCFVFHRTEIQLINLSVDGKLTVFTLLFHDFEEIILKFTHYSIYFCLGIDSFFILGTLLGRRRRKDKSSRSGVLMHAVRQLLPGT